jgi:hypothetical protein
VAEYVLEAVTPPFYFSLALLWKVVQRLTSHVHPLRRADLCASLLQSELDLEKGLEMRKWVLSGILASEETYLSHLEALLLVRRWKDKTYRNHIVQEPGGDLSPGSHRVMHTCGRVNILYSRNLTSPKGQCILTDDSIAKFLFCSGI